MKKILALLLVAVMAMFALAGCGGNQTATTPTPSQSSQTGNTGNTSGGGDQKNPLDGPKPVLKYLGYNVSFDPNTDPMAKVYEETTGYKVEYHVLPAENADEKLLMDVSSGADYDVMQVSPSQFQTLLAQGALMPLTDLLNTYGQDILKGVSEDSWKAMTGSDGQIYGIPYKYPHPQEITTFMVARMDLLKKAGINKLPETIDEFYNTLKTLKAYYGDQYIIFTGPFRQASEAGAGVSWDIPQTITSAFGIYNDWMVDDNGKVIYMTEHENFPKMIEFMQKLMREGLLDRDWAVNNTTTVNEKLSSGKAIIACSNRTGTLVTTPVMMDTLGLDWSDFGYIGALKGSDGTCKYMRTEAINQVTCILKNAKNPEHVINWINIKQQNQLYLNIGVEGTHFTYDENGEINPINPIFAEERGNSYWYLNSTDEAAFAKQWPSRVRKSQAMWEPFDAVTNYANKHTPEIFVPNTFAFMPSLENYSKYNQSLFKSTSDFILQLMAGTKSLNDLNTFMKDWQNNGGEKVRAEMQAWYDDFYGK